MKKIQIVRIAHTRLHFTMAMRASDASHQTICSIFQRSSVLPVPTAQLTTILSKIVCHSCHSPTAQLENTIPIHLLEDCCWEVSCKKIHRCQIVPSIDRTSTIRNAFSVCNLTHCLTSQPNSVRHVAHLKSIVQTVCRVNNQIERIINHCRIRQVK